jgi:hypothetical protein
MTSLFLSLTQAARHAFWSAYSSSIATRRKISKPWIACQPNPTGSSDIAASFLRPTGNQSGSHPVALKELGYETVISPQPKEAVAQPETND